MTVTAAVPLRVEILVTISECAKAEKPRPPYDFGMMMPRKPLSRMNFHTSGGRSMRSWVMSHSSSIPQSSSTGPSTKACSSAVSFAPGIGEHLLPVGLAGEEVRVPPDAAGVERLLLGLRDLRQHLLVDAEEGRVTTARAQRLHDREDARRRATATQSRARPPAARGSRR